MASQRERKSALPPIRFYGYTETRAAVVVEARPFLIVTESTAMIVIGILFSIAGLGALCWLLFNLAVFALPLFAGVSAGLFSLHAGAGPIGAILVGIAAGVTSLALGQTVFSFASFPLLRGLVALLFAAPAAFAGYHAAHGLAALTTSAEGWRQAFACVGALTVGATALARIALPGTARARAPSRTPNLPPTE